MAIVKTDIPTTSSLTEQTIQALMQACPDSVRTELVGITAYDRPIRAMILGTGPRRVLYSAAHHANEWITAPILLKFAEDLLSAVQTGSPIGGMDASELLEKVTFYLVPMVNPDGVDLVTGAISQNSGQYTAAVQLAQGYPTIPFPDGWKANLLGVDLNLNYPAGWLQARENKFLQGYTSPGPRDYVGAAPLDQRETRALAEYTEDVNPELVLAYHTQGEVIYWQFMDILVPGAQELGQQLAQVSGYSLEETPFASAFAGYKDWFIKAFRRPGYTVEVGRGVNPLPLSQFEAIYADNLPLLLTAAVGM